MDKQNIILIGGGGHCKSCIDVIEQEGKFKIAGIIDLKSKIGQNILGYPIIGSDDDIDDIAQNHDYFLVTLGQIKSNELRIKLFDKVKLLNKKLPVVISPSAYVSKHANIEEGTIIMHQAMVNSDCKIGVNCIVNSKALVEHDVVIGGHCHLSTASVVNGNVRIGEESLIGSNATLRNGISIVSKVIIGAGSVVVHNIDVSGTYVGVPSKLKE